MEESRRPILIVEDDPKFGSAIRKLVAKRSPALLVSTASKARSAFADRPLSGAIVDLLLPDGSGLDVVAEFRPILPFLPILLMTGLCAKEVVNQVYDLGIEYVCKPFDPERILAFVSLIEVAQGLHEPTAVQLAAAFATRHQLTECEMRIVALSVVGKTRQELAAELGVAENTLKSEIRSILSKSGEKSLEIIARRIRGDCFGP